MLLIPTKRARQQTQGQSSILIVPSPSVLGYGLRESTRLTHSFRSRPRTHNASLTPSQVHTGTHKHQTMPLYTQYVHYRLAVRPTNAGVEGCGEAEVEVVNNGSGRRVSHAARQTGGIPLVGHTACSKNFHPKTHPDLSRHRLLARTTSQDIALTPFWVSL